MRWLATAVVAIVAAAVVPLSSAARPGGAGVTLTTSGNVVKGDGTTVEEYEVCACVCACLSLGAFFPSLDVVGLTFSAALDVQITFVSPRKRFDEQKAYCSLDERI